MMENPEYASGNEQLNVYARNGYTVGDNLIITMEGQSQPLNTRNLDKIIRKKFDDIIKSYGVIASPTVIIRKKS